MKSLFEKHGKNAIPILQGMMKQDINLPKGFDILDRGNHYIVSKNKESLEVPLCSAKDVFNALNIFAKE